MFRLATEGGASLIEFPSYKIGFSPWELPHWPLEYRHCLNFFDEIWAQSEFVKAAFEPVTDKKIIKMPMCVEVPAVKNSKRERWYLDEDKFYFFMIFDGNSWIQRKNPIAALRAFQRAFNQREKDVSLVVKLINPRQHSDQWRELLNIINSDDRMILIQDNMPRDELIDLFDACDAYVSLHRSEGFGRTIAEAMLLQKPVIATNFSGNVDFCRPDTCYLVDGELIPVEKGDYLFHEGQYWCDPDIDIAAQKMVLVRENINESKKFTQKAFNFVEQHYSRKAVTDWMLSRLGEIRGTH
jgi:glycosyltransferase involved in cell wall biosynthesis